MAEAFYFPDTPDRAKVYDEIVPQINALVAGEPDVVANLANISAVLKEALGVLWVGFYFAKDGQLVLGPFQGPLACTRIDFDKGVCGHSYTQRETVIVPDVEAFPGHIACSTLARSEIVLPIFDKTGTVFGVLDVDSDKPDNFTAADADGLGRVVSIIERII